MKDIVESLLEKNVKEKFYYKKPKKRLGVKGVEEIKNHAFFAQVDWEKMQKKEI